MLEFCSSPVIIHHSSLSYVQNISLYFCHMLKHSGIVPNAILSYTKLYLKMNQIHGVKSATHSGGILTQSTTLQENKSYGTLVAVCTHPQSSYFLLAPTQVFLEYYVGNKFILSRNVFQNIS